MNSRAGEVSIEVTGEDLSELIKEAGGHRIQRVPPTERKGRVHTSTVTVAVMEEATKTEITYNEKDFRLEWYSGSGGGGQHRNKHQNSARITHIPSGTVTTAQTRSRENSFNEAKEALLKLLNDGKNAETHGIQADIRKKQVGSGMRGDKMRTYRFQDNLVKDDASGKTASASKVLSGNFNLLW